MSYTRAAPMPVEIIDPATSEPLGSGDFGGGSGGSLSAQANAANQTSVEGATDDPLSMDLSRRLRTRADLTDAKLDALIAAATDTSDLPIKSPPSKVVSVIPTTQAAVYTTGMCIGGKMTFSGLTNGTGLAAILATAVVKSKISTSMVMDLIIFNSDPTASTVADHTAISIDATDMAKVSAIVKFAATDWTALGAAICAAEVSSQGKIFRSSGSSDVYVALVTRTSITLTSTADVQVVLKSLPDATA